MKDLEKLVDYVKKVGAGCVKYVKYGYTSSGDVYYLKIFLLKPMELRTFLEIVKEVEKSYVVKIYAPHAKAIRLDLKKK
ncbi:MAG: hypothetical protein ABWK05_06395 [Pyrobaculum sp.]